ncbi:MAG: glycosyltransferase [Anaerolineales bacterium]
MRISVIIPTLNESAYLPRLLQALREQTRPPDEVIVADAGSKDNTVSLALEWGAKVVSGGMPAVGRNAGARHAQGEILLFLDADVVPGPFFLERTLSEMKERGLEVATCLYQPLEEDSLYPLLTELANLYLLIMAPISPHAPGFCIFAHRWLHEQIGGFDESLVMAEDHDYVRRAARLGRFGILRHERLYVSMRRLEKEGLIGLGLKYLWCEMHALAGRPIHSIPFRYEFGAFSAQTRQRILGEAYRFSHRFGHLENPLFALSQQAREALRLLANEENPEQLLDRLRQAFTIREIETLRKYIRKRFVLAFHPRFWRYRWPHWRYQLRRPFHKLEQFWSRRPHKNHHQE